ncbi:hypothetical protein [Sinorhizobium terangae]|uniref:hypothetical protein n=1 Tax=Sinorhizobium terangae TaxID=110322 RepID=UPI0016162637|nr:hypothetical protein [Sinorhizobium terangae]MBB4189646.1 hypothetical protein [Sinorhizobium terangae]WFU49540.1 hypothetical protein QA637_09160 [Sinorhizobium terangae]
MGASKGEMTGQPRIKPARILLFVWVQLGVLPVFAKMIGYNFLPSVEWVSRTSISGLATGLVSAALLFWIARNGMEIAPGGPFRKAIGVIAAPFIGYILGKNVVIIAAPMILALIAGHQVELPFTVADVDRNGGRRCNSPLDLQGLPLRAFAAFLAGRAWQPVATSWSSATAPI